MLAISCNFTEHTKQNVDSEILESKQAMAIEMQTLRKEFASSYSNKLNKLVDTGSKQKLDTYYGLVENANYFMDSIKSEMDKLDPMDVQNVELIKNTFVYKGIGDSLFDRINTSIEYAENISISLQQKNKIKAAQDSLFDKPNAQLAEELFSLTNSLGASMIICGFQTELYRISMLALKDE